jgi:Tfp pilus assembly protein PilF
MTATSILLLIALAAQGAPAPFSPAERSGEAYFLFLQARRLDDGGKPAEAEAIYRRAIELAPAAADLHADLAALLARSGRIDDAVLESRAALGLDAANRAAHRILGLVQAALLEQRAAPSDALTLSEAVDHLERAIADGTRDPGAQVTLGSLYLRRGDNPKAIKTLTAFLLDQPGHPQGVMLLAEAYRKNGQSREADALLREFATPPAGPSFNLDAEVGRAEQAEAEDRWAEAAEIWRTIVASGPAGAKYREPYAIALVNSGDLEASRRLLRDLTREAPTDASAWFLLAELETRAGNADAAEDAGRHIVALAADDSRGPLALAQARALRRDFRGVVAILEPPVAALRAADVRSGAFARMAIALSEAYSETNQRARSRTVLEQARRGAPDDLNLLMGLATLYERDRAFDLAEQAFRDVIARDPTHADALNYLGYMLADQGRKLEEAVSLVTRALAVDADNPSYLDSLGWAYFKLSRFDEARQPLERAAAAAPKSSVIQSHLADVYFQVKRYRDAADSWDRALGGDRDGIDVADVTRKRDRAKALAGAL